MPIFEYKLNSSLPPNAKLLSSIGAITKKCHPNEELLNTNPAYALMALNNTWEEITGKRRDPVLMCLLQGWYIALDGTPQHHHDPWCGDLTNYI